MLLHAAGAVSRTACSYRLLEAMNETAAATRTAARKDATSGLPSDLAGLLDRADREAFRRMFGRRAGRMLQRVSWIVAASWLALIALPALGWMTANTWHATAVPLGLGLTVVLVGGCAAYAWWRTWRRRPDRLTLAKRVDQACGLHGMLLTVVAAGSHRHDIVDGTAELTDSEPRGEAFLSLVERRVCAEVARDREWPAFGPPVRPWSHGWVALVILLAALIVVLLIQGGPLAMGPWQPTGQPLVASDEPRGADDEQSAQGRVEDDGPAGQIEEDGDTAPEKDPDEDEASAQQQDEHEEDEGADEEDEEASGGNDGDDPGDQDGDDGGDEDGQGGGDSGDEEGGDTGENDDQDDQDTAASGNEDQPMPTPAPDEEGQDEQDGGDEDSEESEGNAPEAEPEDMDPDDTQESADNQEHEQDQDQKQDDTEPVEQPQPEREGDQDEGNGHQGALPEPMELDPQELDGAPDDGETREGEYDAYGFDPDGELGEEAVPLSQLLSRLGAGGVRGQTNRSLSARDAALVDAYYRMLRDMLRDRNRPQQD